MKENPSSRGRERSPSGDFRFLLGVATLVIAAVGAGIYFWVQESKEIALEKQRVAAAEDAKAKKAAARAAAQKKAAELRAEKDLISEKAMDETVPNPLLTPALTGTVAASAAANPKHLKISAECLSVTPAADLAAEPYKKREVKLRLSDSIRSLGDKARAGVAMPTELEFPTFDNGSLTIVDLEFRPQVLENEGVFFGKVKGETGGGHVILSYVNNALIGAIHSPGLGVFLDIRNATPQGGVASEFFLAELDPDKMPNCGNCKPDANSKFDPSRPPTLVRTTGINNPAAPQ